MNKFELAELFGVIIIVCFQFYIFVRTNRVISLYRTIFPPPGNFEIIRPEISKQYLQQHPKELLDNLDAFLHKIDPPEIKDDDGDTPVLPSLSNQAVAVQPASKDDSDNTVQIDLIVKRKGGNETTDKIVYSLNTYLIRNKGVASDFHLIKDVVERNCDSVETNINQTISLPLYLGLLGTFLGIVIGLFQISGIDFKADTGGLDKAISLLLNGVEIAMIASFMGLLLTIVNSGVFFKGAKARLEDRKNDFYTFIQTDLLPLLNQNINSTLFSLQSNLHKFNEEFKGNVSKLSSVMGRNREALIAQENILNKLDEMDIMTFAKANVSILKELKFSTDRLAGFNQYLLVMNEMVQHTSTLTGKVDDAIQRTTNVDVIGQKILAVFEENQELAKFLQSHYTALDQSHQLITQSVNKVANTLDESLEQLKGFTQERIVELQKITLRELDLMQNQYPEKWKKLDRLENLSYLQNLDRNINEIKMSTAAQIGGLSIEVKTISESVSALHKVIDKWSSRQSWVKRVWEKVKKIK